MGPGKRYTGLEPVTSAWKANVLPLHQYRKSALFYKSTGSPFLSTSFEGRIYFGGGLYHSPMDPHGFEPWTVRL